MNKKGGIVLFLVILSIVSILIIGCGIYLYNFHTFKTLRVCLSESKDTTIPCESSEQCREFASILVPEIDLGNAPDFVVNSFDEVLENRVYCNQTCFVRNIRGVNPETQEFELLDSCEAGEIEIAIDIRGKEAIETLKWLKGKTE